jgi:hypothetical protein
MNRRVLQNRAHFLHLKRKRQQEKKILNLIGEIQSLKKNSEEKIFSDQDSSHVQLHLDKRGPEE